MMCETHPDIVRRRYLYFIFWMMRCLFARDVSGDAVNVVEVEKSNRYSNRIVFGALLK